MKSPNSEIFDVVRKICPKEDIGEAMEGQQSCGSETARAWFQGDCRRPGCDAA